MEMGVEYKPASTRGDGKFPFGSKRPHLFLERSNAQKLAKKKLKTLI